MYVSVVTPPPVIIDVDAAKKHLRVDHADDDAYIGDLVATATGWLDGPDRWLGRALGRQTLELRVDGFDTCGNGIVLPCPPIASVTSVKYIDTAGVEQTIAGTDYRLISGRTLVPVYSVRWPAARCEPEAVRVVYDAGYAAGAVPKPILQAILLLVGHWYENREAALAVKGITAAVELPFAVEALLTPFRVYA